MIRGTTPTITLTINSDSVDLTTAEAVYVTIRQTGVLITKTGEDLTVGATTVGCWLSQKETLKLREGWEANVQVNWTYLDASGVLQRGSTAVGTITIGRQLLDRVVD